MNSYHRMVLTILAAIFCVTSPLCAQAPAEHKTQHIIFVMTDGLRWQEVFSGAEKSLMNKKNGKVAGEASLKKSLLERDSGGAPRRSPALCLGGDGETGPNLR